MKEAGELAGRSPYKDLLNDRNVKRWLDGVVILVYYYLGFVDGMSATLESFRGLNPEPFEDAEWRGKLRDYLPPELAALRQPHADIGSARRVIQREVERALQKPKRRRGKAVKR
jgi:hypothetical protein